MRRDLDGSEASPRFAPPDPALAPNPEVIAMIKAEAERLCWTDHPGWFDLSDYSGGNPDDAFRGGQDIGRIHFAREILKALGVGFGPPMAKE